MKELGVTYTASERQVINQQVFDNHVMIAALEDLRCAFARVNSKRPHPYYQRVIESTTRQLEGIRGPDPVPSDYEHDTLADGDFVVGDHQYSDEDDDYQRDLHR